MKKGLRGINPASKPSGDGCVECLSAGVPSVGTSDAATVLRVSMHQSMRQRQGIRSLPASSRVRIGSSITRSRG
jgi:hypothetical protein